MKVELLNTSLEVAYESFVSTAAGSLVYGSLAYRNFLRRATAAEDRYLVATERGAIAGVLPAFLQRSPTGGNVLNSLPFFGSIGGVIAQPGQPAAGALLQEFDRMADVESCVSRTIVTSPFAEDTTPYRALSYTFCEPRTAQVTPLPPSGDHLADRLLAMFDDPRPRNIRKAVKSGVTVQERWDEEALRFLGKVHAENIEALGGISKRLDVFLSVPDCFARTQYSVFVAERDGRPVAALLVFFYNGTAEYFTPAVLQDERGYQPLSLVLFEAMQKAAMRGCHAWNWGGTWASQTTLYEFKRRWGAVDRPYWYFTSIEDRVRDLSREEILAAHPLFYVCPFEALRQPA